MSVQSDELRLPVKRLSLSTKILLKFQLACQNVQSFREQIANGGSKSGKRTSYAACYSLNFEVPPKFSESNEVYSVNHVNPHFPGSLLMISNNNTDDLTVH